MSFSSTRKAIGAIFLILVFYQIVMFFLFGYDNEAMQHQHHNDSNENNQPWIRHSQPQKKTPSSTTLQYSDFHCVGDNFLGNAWMYQSCHYRNLCFDAATKAWFLRGPSPTQQALQDELESLRRSSKPETNKAYNFAQISTMASPAYNYTTPPFVSAAVGMIASSSSPPPSMSSLLSFSKWSPNIIPSDAATRSSTVIVEENEMVILPIFLGPNSNSNDGEIPPLFSTFTLLTDVLLPLYNLVGMFGWRSRTIAVYIMNEDDLFFSTTGIANIDTKKQQQQRQQQQYDFLEQALERYMGYKLWRPTPPPIPNTNNVTTTTCFAHGAAGTGMLTVTGGFSRGFRLKDYKWESASHQRTNVGRGALFWDFTRSVIQKSSTSTAPTNKSDDSRIIKIVLAGLESSGGGHPSSILHRHLADSTISWKNQTAFQLHNLNARDSNHQDSWITLAASSHVWISLANETWAWPAMFLPKDSTLILLYDEEIQVNKKNKIPIRSDFDFWNNMGHIKVHWLSLQNEDIHSLLDLIVQLVERHRQESSPISTTTTTNEKNEEVWSFNGVNTQLAHRSHPITRVHCVGENFQDSATDYRSCHYENLCFDTELRDFVIFPEEAVETHHFDTTPTNHTKNNVTASIGSRLRPHDRVSTDPEHASVQIGQSIRLASGSPWSPSLWKDGHRPVPKSFYQLPPNVIWLPYYPEQPNVNNPGHLLWDYWLPLYTLVDMFGHLDKHILLTNVDPYCVAYNAESPGCYKLTTKFLPLLGVHPVTFVNTYNSRLMIANKKHNSNNNSPNSSIVCAKNGLAGIGMLTDHGFKKHGQLIDDYKGPYNHGRGISFWRFRNFMLYRSANLLGTTTKGDNTAITQTPSFVITFSVLSSNNPRRRRNFEKQIQAIRDTFRDDPSITVQSVVLAELSLADQIATVKESSIFVSVIGGSTSTAMFLERNSCLVLYFNDQDDFVKGTKPNTNMPVMMDWDFWNHASYLRVHWLPIQPMDDDGGIRLLTRLVESELESFRYSS